MILTLSEKAESEISAKPENTSLTKADIFMQEGLATPSTSLF